MRALILFFLAILLAIFAVVIYLMLERGAVYESTAKQEYYLGPNSTLPASDLAVLPIIVHHPKGHFFDACLRRGFDMVATTLAESFSSADMPLPGAVFEVQRKYYADKFFKKFPVFGKNKKAEQQLKQSCNSLKTEVIFFAELTMEPEYSEVVVRDYDCKKKKAGVWEKTFKEEGMSPPIMEILELRAAVATAEEIVTRFPGDAGFIEDGAESKCAEAKAMEEASALLEKDDPFSLMQAIDIAAKAASSAPRDPRAWALLSEAWSAIAADFQEDPSLMEHYLAPAFVASRIALLLDGENPAANRAAAWVDFLGWREYRARPEIEKALEAEPENRRAMVLKHRIFRDNEALDTYLKDNPDDIFAKRRMIEMSSGRDAYKLIEKVTDESIGHAFWAVVMEEQELAMASKFQKGIYYYLSAVSSLKSKADKAIRLLEREWNHGRWAVVPEVERLGLEDYPARGALSRVMGILLNKLVTAEGEYVDVRALKAARAKWLQTTLKEPKRWKEQPLPCLNTTPVLFLDYLDHVAFQNIEGHLRMLNDLAWEDEFLERGLELKTIYPETPESYAQLLEVYYDLKDYEKAHKLFSFAFEFYGDNPKLNLVILELDELSPTTHTEYEVIRIPLRWPYDYEANMKVARMYNFKGTEEYFFNAINAAIEARPFLDYPRRLKAKRLRLEGRFKEAAEVDPKAPEDRPYVPISFAEKTAELEEKMKEDPEKFKGHEYLSDLYFEFGDLENAVRVREQEVKYAEGPVGKYRVELKIADMYLDEGMHERAMNIYSQIVRRSAQQDALLKMAKGYNAIGQYDKADYFFRKSISRYPSSSYSYLRWGRALMDRGEMGQAEEKLEEAFSKYKSWDNLFGLLELRIRQDKVKSFKCLDDPKVSKEWPMVFFYQLALWKIYGEGDWEDIRGIASEMDNIIKDCSLKFLVETCMAIEKGQYKQAEKLFYVCEERGDIVSNPEEHYYTLVMSLAKQRRKRKAEEVAAQFYLIDFKNTTDQLIAARIDLESRKFNQAREHLRPVKNAANFGSGVLMNYLTAELFLDLADRTRKKSDYEMGLELFKRTRRKSDYPWISDYYIGRCYEGMKFKEEAREHYQKALDIAPGFTRAKKRLEAL
jgi:tetratricopeptide (TPR) repeat protein